MYLTVDLVVGLAVCLVIFVFGLVGGIMLRPESHKNVVGVMTFDTKYHLALVSWDSEDFEEMSKLDYITFRVDSTAFHRVDHTA